jgi:hypothetical protein
MGNNRDAYLKGFFTEVTKRQSLDMQDPSFLVIEKKLEDFLEEELLELFEVYSTSSRYSENGFSSLLFLTKAIDDFKEQSMSRIWKKEKVFERSSLLKEKMVAIFDSVKSLPAEEVDQWTKKVVLSKYKEKGKNTAFFSIQEIEVVKDKGVAFLYKTYMENSSTMLRDEIEKAWKNILVRKRFTRKNSNILESPIASKENKNPISLMAGLRKM